MTNVPHRFGRAWRERLTVLRPTRPTPSPANPPLAFRAVERVLALFVAGLTDGAFVVTERHGNGPGEAYTDGRTIFLPEQIDRYPDRAGNLRLYKALIAHAAAQVFYGTLAHGGGIDRLRAAPEPDLALELFGIVEGARLTARLGADFPGIGRDLAGLASDALAERPDVAALSHRPQLLEALVRHTLGHDPRAAVAARHR